MLILLLYKTPLNLKSQTIVTLLLFKIVFYVYIMFLYIETTGIEEVQQPTTNTDKKKLLQYYPTFPKKTDDDTWTEPAEPIKVLDE